MKVGTKENHELIRAIEENDLTNVIKFLDEGCCPNPIDEYATSPLIVAIKRPGIDFSVFRHLLEYGADPNLANGWGITPLEKALEKRDKPLIELLLQFKADPHQQDKYEISPCQKVIMDGDIELIKLLIENGVDINHPYPSGQTLLEIAFMQGNPAVVNVLKYYGAFIPALKTEEPVEKNPAYERFIARLEELENKIEDANTRIRHLEQKNRMLESKISELRERPVYNPSQVSKTAMATPLYDDYEDEDEEDEFPLPGEEYMPPANDDWEYQKKDKTCVMCAGTGYMEAVEGEEDETECNEVTCPYCQGAGIE